MGYITGIHHVSLKCRQDQYEEVFRFYHEVLGMPVKRTMGNGAMLDTGAGLIEIFNNGEDGPEAGMIRHFALATSHVDEVVASAAEAGYKVKTEPKDIVIRSEPDLPARIAFIIGPLGEEIELFYEKY
ncbi:MAG: VOC family protein [Solobacterium sp.]|nr:VOC family protein [Solobacterium sp.]